MVVILILSLMGQNQSLSRRSKSSNSSWLEKLPRIKCIVQPNSLKPKKSCPYQPVIGYYDQWMKSLALKILGWFDRVYSEATSFTQTMERNCSCHRCFATLQLRSLLDDAGCIDCNFICILKCWVCCVHLHQVCTCIFWERENPFCRRPLAGCCLKPLRPRLTDILEKYSEIASAPHWDLVEWTMSPCHTLTGDSESFVCAILKWEMWWRTCMSVKKTRSIVTSWRRRQYNWGQVCKPSLTCSCKRKQNGGFSGRQDSHWWAQHCNMEL